MIIYVHYLGGIDSPGPALLVGEVLPLEDQVPVEPAPQVCTGANVLYKHHSSLPRERTLPRGLFRGCVSASLAELIYDLLMAFLHFRILILSKEYKCLKSLRKLTET